LGKHIKSIVTGVRLQLNKNLKQLESSFTVREAKKATVISFNCAGNFPKTKDSQIVYEIIPEEDKKDLS
jgi:hypothetical protein